jgi:hypothetical protein
MSAGTARWVGHAHRHLSLEAAFVEQTVDCPLEIADEGNQEMRVLEEQGERQLVPDLPVPPAP